MATYAYDVWGNMTYCNAGTDVAYINPFLYRGYYYDSESGLYYLMSRYYDPEIGQFISMDTVDYLDPKTIGGVDLYAYCNKSPVSVYPIIIVKNNSVLNDINKRKNSMRKTRQSQQQEVDGFSYIVTGIDFVFATTIAYMYGFAQSYGRMDMMNFAIRFGGVLAKITNVLNIVGTAINTVTNIVNNYQNGASGSRILADAIVDIGIGVVSYKLSISLGVLMGAAIPGVGPLIGAVAGLLVAELLNSPGLNQFLKDAVYESINFFVRLFE